MDLGKRGVRGDREGRLYLILRVFARTREVSELFTCEMNEIRSELFVQQINTRKSNIIDIAMIYRIEMRRKVMPQPKL